MAITAPWNHLFRHPKKHQALWGRKGAGRRGASTQAELFMAISDVIFWREISDSGRFFIQWEISRIQQMEVR